MEKETIRRKGEGLVDCRALGENPTDEEVREIERELALGSG